jgi:hypothetical protein
MKSSGAISRVGMEYIYSVSKTFSASIIRGWSTSLHSVAVKASNHWTLICKQEGIKHEVSKHKNLYRWSSNACWEGEMVWVSECVGLWGRHRLLGCGSACQAGCVSTAVPVYFFLRRAIAIWPPELPIATLPHAAFIMAVRSIYMLSMPKQIFNS